MQVYKNFFYTYCPVGVIVDVKACLFSKGQSPGPADTSTFDTASFSSPTFTVLLGTHTSFSLKINIAR